MLWFILTIWYEHPFLTAFLGIFGRYIYKWFTEPEGQPSYGTKKKGSQKEETSEPAVLIIGAGSAGLAVHEDSNSTKLKGCRSVKTKQDSICYCGKVKVCWKFLENKV